MFSCTIIRCVLVGWLVILVGFGLVWLMGRLNWFDLVSWFSWQVDRLVGLVGWFDFGSVVRMVELVWLVGWFGLVGWSVVFFWFDLIDRLVGLVWLVGLV